MNHPSNHLAAVVLAAGFSRRFGNENKLHATLESGISVAEQVLRSVAEFPFEQRVVVCQGNDTVIQELATRYSIRPVTNENAAQGIGSSIATGIGSLDRDRISGAAIFLGDMPFIKPETISAVVAEFARQETGRIIRPSFSNQAGHPVIFPSHLFAKLGELDQDDGASRIVGQHADLLSLVPTNDSGVLKDIDIASDLPT